MRRASRGRVDRILSSSIPLLCCKFWILLQLEILIFTDPQLILKACPPYRTDRRAISCATTIQAVMRSALARKEVTKVMREVYRKDFDPDSGDYYYTNVRTNEVRWDNPAEALSLIKAEDAAPELGPDSQLIVSKDSEIELNCSLSSKSSSC